MAGDGFITERDRELFLTKEKRSRRIGLYLTIIFHLLLLIVLLIFSISTVRKTELSFITDSEGRLAREQELKKIERDNKIKAIAEDELRQQLSQVAERYRAVPVQRTSQYPKDERNTDADKLYKDAEDLQQRIKDAAKLDKQDGVDEVKGAGAIKPAKESLNDGQKSYSGPSVLNWYLDDRKALSLPIPVYKCRGGGDVTVQIYVGRNGYVKQTSILESSSTADQCIRNAALAAAGRSRFSASERAPEPQVGQITYRFIAQ